MIRTQPGRDLAKIYFSCINKGPETWMVLECSRNRRKGSVAGALWLGNRKWRCEVREGLPQCWSAQGSPWESLLLTEQVVCELSLEGYKLHLGQVGLWRFGGVMGHGKLGLEARKDNNKGYECLFIPNYVPCRVLQALSCLNLIISFC